MTAATKNMINGIQSKIVTVGQRALVVLTMLIGAGDHARAADNSDEIKQLKQQVEELERKLRSLEQKRELDTQAAEEKRKTAASVTAGPEGLVFSSADTNFVLRVGAHVQADGRFYIDDHIAGNDTFLLRRVRPIFEGSVFKHYDYRLMLDFGANTASANTVQEAYVNLHYWPEFQVQVGKFKPPVGLERLQSDVNVRFIERGFPTGLVPNRDVGVQVQGLLWGGALEYQAGIFNGVADGGSSDIETADDRKDFAGRIFVRPLKNTPVEPLRGLGFGVAGTWGYQAGALPKYVTPGQQTFFSYSTNFTAHGNHWRLVPQAYWYWGPFGLLGEYALSTQRIQSGTDKVFSTMDNKAWQIAGSWVLTGEENTFQGVKPSRPLSLADAGFGAWELVARCGRLTIDQDQFPSVAAANSASQATSWGAGVNWYLNRNIKLSLDYEQTKFRNGSAKIGNVTSQDEKIIFTRAQLAF